MIPRYESKYLKLMKEKNRFQNGFRFFFPWNETLKEEKDQSNYKTRAPQNHQWHYEILGRKNFFAF